MRQDISWSVVSEVVRLSYALIRYLDTVIGENWSGGDAR